MTPLLLPQPKKIAYATGQLSTRGLPVTEIIDGSLVAEAGDEAYAIEANADGIKLFARTPAGLRWARATLGQLLKEPTLPCLRIDDAPRFAHRGLMLDISRDRVPTMTTLLELVDLMAGWKMNHLQLYVEHTIAYAGHEEVWRAASPLTLEEISALDTHCRSRGISLNANQNCLGHFERWLVHPRYNPLAECPEGRVMAGSHFRYPNTLCPLDPRSHELVADLLGQLLPCCSGPYANIGCDEPWDLGEGRSREACEAKGRATVFSEYVTKVAETAVRLGKRPQFWCDPHPNESDDLPRDLVALIWGYGADSNFSDRLQAHRSQGREAWVAPGTSCWNSFTGRTENRRENLRRASLETDASGLLGTAWGDNGHRQPWPTTLCGFAETAEAAWSGQPVNEEAIGQWAFGEKALGPWLSRLGRLDEELGKGERPVWGDFPTSPIGNANALWSEAHLPLHQPKGPGDVASWEEVAGRIATLRRDLEAMDSTPYHDECTLSLDLAQWTTDRALSRRSGLTDEAHHGLAEPLQHIIASHRRQWLQRCRYGGLEDSTRRYFNLL